MDPSIAELHGQTHTVQVKATDGLGRSTTKTLNVEVQRDTTKPTLEVGGELANAPEGWVEQESYGLTASATDQGGGVTSLAFKIDGKAIALQGQSCLDGGCGASISKPTNMADYAGGAHSAEVIATDGAGNTTTDHWAINVDPEGHISTSEAEDTLKALDETSQSTLVASTKEAVSAEERAAGNDPRLVGGESVLETEGTPDRSTISTDPEGRFEVELPEGESISAEPTDVNESATPPVVAEEAAAVTGDTSNNSDTIVRPTYDGLLTFASIRDTSAPEEYSWKVDLSEEQIVKPVNSQFVEIAYEDGHEVALVSTEQAHDAVGTAVPTRLSVSEGDVITLTVEHREASFVYPVVAGTGWEGGFTSYNIEMPPTDAELREQEEQEEADEEASGTQEESGQYSSYKPLTGHYAVAAGGLGEVGPPEPTGGKISEGEASVSSLPAGWPKAVSRKFKEPACLHIYGVVLPEPPKNENENPVCPRVPSLVVRGWAHGHFHYSKEHEVWWDRGREGEIDCGVDFEYESWHMWNKDCHFAGLNQQVGNTTQIGAHIVIRHNWRISQDNSILLPNSDLCISGHNDLYSSGYVSGTYVKHGDPDFTGDGEACDWQK